MPLSLSRRSVLAGLGASALVPEAPAAAGSPEDRRRVAVQGRVLARRQDDEAAPTRGLANVMVSNGRDVALTDADGRWSLTGSAGDCLFVIKPPHHSLPQSEGAIRANHIVIDGGAAAAQEVVFILDAAPEPTDFRVLLVTDTQPDSDEELGFVRDDIFSNLWEHQASFVIHHGDVVGDALDLYPRYLELLRATKLPWYHCAGNHDLDRKAETDARSRDTWMRTFGPRHHAFQYGEATFIVLDNVYYEGRASGRYRGRIGQDQLHFVQNVLNHVPKPSLLVFSMHIPLKSYLAPDEPADNTENFEELLALLGDRPHCVSFSGHLHATEHHYLPYDNGKRLHHHHVLTAACGSWWSGARDPRGVPAADSTDGTPNGFHLLHVEGNSYRTRFIAAKQRRPQHFNVVLVPGGEVGPSKLLVNVFDGGPRSKVRGHFLGGEWIELEPFRTLDPLICRAYGEHKPKTWVEPTVSSHIWCADVPAHLPKGPYALALQIVNEYGERTEARLLVEVG